MANTTECVVQRADQVLTPFAANPVFSGTCFRAGDRLRPLAFVLVIGVTVCLHGYGLGSWPWDHDEVPSLIELGILRPSEGVGPVGQFDRLPRLVPLWYGVQGLLLHFLPADEWGTRILAATCGILTVACAFAFALRHWGLAYALALAVLLNGSQCFIWLSQQNRFYTMALLFFTLAVAAIWSRAAGIKMPILCGLLAAGAILSHNLLVVVFVLAFAAACLGYPLGLVPRSVWVRCGSTAAVSVLVYAVYLRPIMQNWISGGTGGTHPLVSFVAQAGLPTLALALFGTLAGLASARERRRWTWWILLFGFSLVFVAVSPLILSAWNPRYAVLFMPPMWVLAAFGTERVARSLRSKALSVGWYSCVTLLLLVKLASHYQDGSRHDFRTAAHLVVKAVPSDPLILSNWPETLQYYLPADLRSCVRTLNKDRLPPAECWIVYASNSWEPVFTLPDRTVEIMGEFAKRRFDEQSHVIRVYHVRACASSSPLLLSSPARPTDSLRELASRH